jgi:hypothetical protein
MFKNHPQGNRLRGQSTTYGGTEYKQILIDEKLQIGKRRQTTNLRGRSPLRRRSFALECSAISGKKEEL